MRRNYIKTKNLQNIQNLVKKILTNLKIGKENFRNILKYQIQIKKTGEVIKTDKIKQALNNFKACSDKNGTCLISTPDIQIEKMIKSLGIEMPDLTTIDKIDKFKKQLNKYLFM